MKLELTWAELARAAGGRLTKGDAGARIDVISTDTRRPQAGGAFWALRGERLDAHDFLDAKSAQTYAGWVVAAGRLKTGAPTPPQIVEVPDTLKALHALAHFHRKRFDIPVVGVVGSNGKTTTKEMLRAICSRIGSVCASHGNWNNEVGVPLSVLEMRPEHRHAIFELAACRLGEIRELSRIAQPTIAVLTNIGPDHLESFGTIETTFQTNSEIVAALPDDGAAVINADDPWLAALETRLGARAVTYGTGPNCRVRIEEGNFLVIDRHRVALTLRSFGTFSQYNAAAAAAAAWVMGLPPETICSGLQDHTPSMMRQEPLPHPSGAALVLDAYNANPASMRASIEAFYEQYSTRPKTLILGDMKELGVESAKFHRELGVWLSQLDLKAVYLAGPEMKSTADALSAAKPRFEVEYSLDSSQWSSKISSSLTSRDAVLFKASRAMRLEELAKAL
ncbi:MAG: UDP-N-acetylmuramoyl-tripeptide--D-alanyl-D-alanine ligase [Elusimicrobiota bacterium]